VTREVEDERTVRRYLLDELDPEERQRLEERLLDDGDDFFNQLQLAEEELADDYVTGALSDSERARYTESLLSIPQQYEQARFAETLRSYFASREPAKKNAVVEKRVASSWWQKLAALLGLDRPAVGFSLACALVLAVALSAWLGVRMWRLQDNFDRLQAHQQSSPASVEIKDLREQLAQERARRDNSAQELLREQEQRASIEQELARLKAGDGVKAVVEKSPPSPPAEIAKGTQQTAPRNARRVLAVTLTSGLIRESGGMATVNITPNTSVVQLRLDIAADDYKNYRATLENAEGQALLTRTALRARAERNGGLVITFDVPVKLLEGGGNFQVGLVGLPAGSTATEVAKYYFKVVRD
jgi:hypothetical protein